MWLQFNPFLYEPGIQFSDSPRSPECPRPQILPLCRHQFSSFSTSENRMNRQILFRNDDLQSFMSWQIVILYRRKVEAAELGNFEASTEHWVRSGHLDIFILSHALSRSLAWALCCAWFCGYRNKNCIAPALEALTVSQNRFTHYHMSPIYL